MGDSEDLVALHARLHFILGQASNGSIAESHLGDPLLLCEVNNSVGHGAEVGLNGGPI